MKIGLVGYQGSGKSTLFEWLTGVKPDLAVAHVGQNAMAAGARAPDRATVRGLSSQKSDHGGPGTGRYAGPGPQRTKAMRPGWASFARRAAWCWWWPASAARIPWPIAPALPKTRLLADLEIVSGRVERLRESVKKPRPNRDQELAELAALEQVLAALEAGQPLQAAGMSDEQLKATRSFRLLSEKPMLVLVQRGRRRRRARPLRGGRPAGQPTLAVPAGLELELARMTPEDRADFQREMGISGSRRDEVLRAMLDVSGQMLYFTAGEKEVRTWMLRQGGTALEAADNIHSDLARGFIRAEVTRCEDLVRLGSEREVKAHNLVRQEPKDYVVRDGDILNIRFSV